MSRPRQPRLLDRYELVQPLGAGGMAKVYLARLADPSGFDRHFALKLLESVDDPAGAEEQVLFRHETRVLGSLHHQHIAQIFDAGVAPDGAHYLVMEYVHGATLREVLEAARHAGRQLPLGFGLTVIAAAAAGLHHAHQRRSADGPMGIVHRDVSPSNLMIGHDGSVKLIDFGIAWSRNRSLETRRGIVRGKPGYMSPEQLMELPLDGRSDVFALGVVAYEATTQTRAFRASSEHETARRVVQGKVRSPAAARPGYPAELTELVMTALAPDPASRFASAGELARACADVAGRLGLSLGPRAVSDVMRSLFPDAREPWLAPPMPPGLDAATATGRRRALARGSASPDGPAAGRLAPAMAPNAATATAATPLSGPGRATTLEPHDDDLTTTRFVSLVVDDS